MASKCFVYDRPGIVDKYLDIVNQGNFHEQYETKCLKKLLPNLKGKRIVDLGCGHGGFVLAALEEGASVVGVDISYKMIEEAKRRTSDEKYTNRVEFKVDSMDDVQFPESTFDLFVSSYALHLCLDYNELVKKVFRSLKPGGQFVFSTVHPIHTAGCERKWLVNESGNKIGWVIQDFNKETPRKDNFLVDDYFINHRTFETYLNTLLNAGFILNQIAEPLPELDKIEPQLQQIHDHRPYILQISCTKPKNH